jgi:centrosomal protein CEP104
LPAAAAKDAEPVVEVAGEYVAAAFFSRNWQLRDAATGWVTDLVRNGKVSGPDARETAKGLGRLSIRGMKDKVAGVFNASLPLFQVRQC